MIATVRRPAGGAGAVGEPASAATQSRSESSRRARVRPGAGLARRGRLEAGEEGAGERLVAGAEDGGEQLVPGLRAELRRVGVRERPQRAARLLRRLGEARADPLRRGERGGRRGRDVRQLRVREREEAALVRGDRGDDVAGVARGRAAP